MNLAPILTMNFPFFRNIYHSQIQHFQQAFIGRKYRFNCPRKASQTIHTCNQDIFYTTVLQTVESVPSLTFTLFSFR